MLRSVRSGRPTGPGYHPRRRISGPGGYRL